MVFVTGATGLVGSHLILELLRRETPVRALYRRESGREDAESLWEAHGIPAARIQELLQWVQGDILDVPFLEEVLEGVQTVYHCAALVSFDPTREAALLKTNGEGTANLVNVSLVAGVATFCHVSSIATVDGTKSPLTESDPWDPARTHPYATSKYLAEMEVWRGAQEGLRTVIVNPGVIFGEGSWKEGSGAFFSRVASGLRHYPPGGTGFIGVQDVIACMLHLTAHGPYCERFILVAENTTFQSVLTTIADSLGVPPPHRELRQWQLEVLWRLDALRAFITKKSRLLSKHTARSLGAPSQYSSEKVMRATGYQFQPLEPVLQSCARAFQKTSDKI